MLLNACSTIGEGLSGSKKKGSEEFLVEKKAPLILPPSFGELPTPETDIKKNTLKNESELSIKKMVDQNSSLETNPEDSGSYKSVENSIIEKINKKTIKENLQQPTEEKIKKSKKKSFFKRFKEKFN